ncbi:MAG TPA: hypothetical protein ENK18_07360 [Deltaproteobacteria bacterium]|nr:hypothetical protein [Deltaproteobacteria bacterium]
MVRPYQLSWAGLTLLLSGSLASAAEITKIPDPMELQVGLGYAGSNERGGLQEAGLRIADRRISRHDLTLSAEASFFTGVSFGLALGITPSLRFAYPTARPMIIEPLDGSGSYLTGEPGTGSTLLQAGGLTGLWLSTAVAPFSESYARNQRASWRLELGVRTSSPHHNLWTAPGGRRGAAPGGSALRLAGAFSTERGAAAPWIQGVWNKENRVKVDIVDESGITWAEDLQLAPASTFDLLSGVEIQLATVPSSDTHLALEPWLGTQYRSWEDIASGVYLPNVLDGARTIPVTSGDSLALRAGLALKIATEDAFWARLGMDIRYGTPFRPEHIYPVRTTADTWRLGWSIQLDGLAQLASPGAPGR